MEPIKTVYGWIGDDFEKECKDLVEKGYLLVSTNCEFIAPNSPVSQGTPIWQAIFALPNVISK